MKTDFRISDVDDALEFVLRRVAGLAHEIRAEAQMQSSDVANPDGQNDAARKAQEPRGGRKAKQPVRRNEKYEGIDKALRELAAARPKSHGEVFRLLDDRRVAIPSRRPFKSAGGWLKGFQQNRHAASAWLSQAWGRLSLPAFARGPKK